MLAVATNCFILNIVPLENSKQEKQILPHLVPMAAFMKLCHIQHFPYTTVGIFSSLARWKGSAALHQQMPSPASCIPSGLLETRGEPSVQYERAAVTKPMPQFYLQCAIRPGQNVVRKHFPMKTKKMPVVWP